MTHNKAHYQAIIYNGFKWYCFEEGVHYFSKRLDNGLYAEICCKEEQLTNGSFQYIAAENLTLSKECIKQVKRKWRSHNAKN